MTFTAEIRIYRSDPKELIGDLTAVEELLESRNAQRIDAPSKPRDIARKRHLRSVPSTC